MVYVLLGNLGVRDTSNYQEEMAHDIHVLYASSRDLAVNECI
jgi:hypothetical protein